MKGFEPPRRKAPDPKSGASTSFATSAHARKSFSSGAGVLAQNRGYAKGKLTFLKFFAKAAYWYGGIAANSLITSGIVADNSSEISPGPEISAARPCIHTAAQTASNGLKI